MKTHPTQIRWMAAIAAAGSLLAGCESASPVCEGFDFQVWNASDADLDHVAIHCGENRFGVGVLSSGDYKVFWVEQTLAADLTLTYLSEANEEKELHLGDLPRDYMGRAFIIKFVSEDEAEILVQDEVEI